MQTETPDVEQSAPAPGRVRLRIPVMTFALAGANILMAGVQYAASGWSQFQGPLGKPFVDWALGVKVPSLIAHGEYWRLITANFLHGSPWHLFSNMLGLILIGGIIEAYYGPARMFVIYILAAVAGAIGSYMNTPAVSLGASTGVLGLIGAMIAHNLRYHALLPRRVTRMLPFVVGMLVFMLMLDAGNGEVDVAGHLFGLAAGFALAFLLESRVAGADQDQRDWLPLPTALATALALVAYGAGGLIATLPSEVPLLRTAHGTDESAISDLTQAVDRRPYFVEARLKLSAMLALRGKDEEADAQYARALRDRPSDALLKEHFLILTEGYALHGQIAQKNHMPQTAVEYYARSIETARKALAKSPEDEELQAVLAQQLNALAYTDADDLHRNLNEAEKSAIEAVQLDPDDAEIIDTLAWVHFQQERYAQALSEQQRAIRLWPQTRALMEAKLRLKGLSLTSLNDSAAELYFHLGAINERLGHRSEARDAYERALKAVPGFRKADEGLRRLGLPGDGDAIAA